jgi:hypothetical protein
VIQLYDEPRDSAGRYLADLDECPHCEGAGVFWDDQTGQPDSDGGSWLQCHVCGGEKVVDTSPCIACGAPSYDHDEGCPVAHDCGNPNCPGPDYGPQECAACTRPIHGGPDYCVSCAATRQEVQA